MVTAHVWRVWQVLQVLEVYEHHHWFWRLWIPFFPPPRSEKQHDGAHGRSSIFIVKLLSCTHEQPHHHQVRLG
jgi:hypothetical protein